MSAVRTRSRVPDAVCAAAGELAADAAVVEAGSAAFVGEPLGISAEDERLVLHRFECRIPAYRGWYWAVVVTRAPRAKIVTVDEVALLPGDGALLAKEWVPWSDRVQAGDLGVGDLLPTAADDPRLALRNSDVEELSDDSLFFELGLGRSRVLSLEGREIAATRWYQGDSGPSAAISRSAPAQCATCGFYVRLVGGLGQLFGVCSNEYAPDDASVVADDHGCGAHSEALVLPSAHPQPVRLDDDAVEEVTELLHHAPSAVERAEATAGADGEPYGHS
ncbi:MAG: hypothetical protein JWN96_2575 [Mycobacterium sp.]|jgi:hypothetical protein|nr:hypothetical protein [Mycobacterium sp.]